MELHTLCKSQKSWNVQQSDNSTTSHNWGSPYLVFYWLKNIIKENSNKLLAICLSLILAGAIGNVIDSVFYGYLFTESYFQIAEFSPGNGYEGIFYGNVVDMFQFPLFSWIWPDWFPFVGGKEFTFFEPVFNIADSVITIGITMMIIFNKSFFPKN